MGSCDYYLCMNEAYLCDQENYLYNFGYKYCEAYNKEEVDDVSQEGKSWLDRVRLCLQYEVEDMGFENFDWSKKTCSHIKKKAFDSHSDCYYETGFCDLTLSDKVKIIDVFKRELYRPALWREALQIEFQCIRQGEEYD